MSKLLDFLTGGFEFKSLAPVRRRSLDEIGRAIEAGHAGRLLEPADSNALYSTAVLCIVRVIADGIAQVPFRLQKSGSGRRGEDATDHPVYELLRHEPNEWQTSYEFREQFAIHAGLTGNAYIFINRDVRGVPQELYAFLPNSVTAVQNDDMSISYRVTTTNGSYIDVPAEDMWHIKGPSWDGVVGLNATKLAREAIGLALASEQFGANLFKHGARPSGILTSPTNLTPDQKAALKKAWQDQYSGVGNAHKTALVEGGITFQSIASTANEAQWVESRKFQIEELCRAFRVLPIMVMQSGATSYNSVEQLLLAHLTHTLMPWYERIEQSARKALLTKEEKKAGYYIKLDSRALMEASTTDRMAYYNAGRTQGWLTTNEIREKEDLPRSDDPMADKLMPAANLFGQQADDTSETNMEKQDENNGNAD